MIKSENVFTEKYRPATLDDVIGQEHIVNRLKGFVKTKKCPHMGFAGDPGIGKTTCAIAFLKDFYGEKWSRYKLELNASDEGSIAVIRGKVKDFTKRLEVTVPFKFIFLDEVDYMDWKSQPALRRIMEVSSRTCRFILSYNYPNKIIKPIQDRCAEYRFSPIKVEPMADRLKEIVDKEDMIVSAEAVLLLAQLSRGSMRKPLNVLETAKDSGVNELTKQDIYDYTYWVDYDKIRELLINIKDTQFKEAEETLRYMVYEKCYEASEILRALDEEIQVTNIFDIKFKLNFIDDLSRVDLYINRSANSYLALRGFTARMMKLMKVV